MKHIYGIAAALVATSTLGGCGGGSDDDKTYAANAAWAHLFERTSTWQLVGDGSSAGQHVSLLNAELSFSLLEDGTFAPTGETGRVRKLTTSVTIFNQSPTSSDTTYYLNASNGFIGSVGSDGSCSVPANVSTPPASATVGNSGTLATWTEYSSCDGTGVKTGTDTSTWSIEKANSQVFFCSTDVYTSVDGSQTSTQKQCFDISETGALQHHAKISATATDHGTSSTVEMYTPLTPG